MEEQWKDIYFEEDSVVWDYRGLYQVSNMGRIKSLERINSQNHLLKEKILQPQKTRDYLFVILCKNGKKKQFKVHRLVAFMFISNDDPLNKTQVNHINEFEKDDNCVENLEWVTPKENCNYGSRNKRLGIASGKSRSIFVYFLKENGDKWFDEPLCINELSRRTGITNQTLGNSLRNKRPLSAINAKFDHKYINSKVILAEED